MSTATSTSPCTRCGSSSFIFSVKCCCAVERRASSGQGRNQSIVVQFTSAGKERRRERNCDETGEKVRTTCRFCLHWETKYWYFSFGVRPSDTSSTSLPRSSSFQTDGISPLLSKLQMSSTFDSCRICVSEYRNTVGLLSMPAIFFFIL